MDQWSPSEGAQTTAPEISLRTALQMCLLLSGAGKEELERARTMNVLQCLMLLRSVRMHRRMDWQHRLPGGDIYVLMLLREVPDLTKAVPTS